MDATPLPSAGDAVPCGAMPRKPAPPPKPVAPLPPSLRLLLMHAREAAGLSRGELAARLADAHGEADSRRWRRLIERYGPKVRQRIASQVDLIRHWQVFNSSYADAPTPRTATWFVDPPYEAAGRHYRFGSEQLDYEALGTWCRSRPGQVIVCENEGATWLPFRFLADVKTTRAGKRSVESVWLSAWDKERAADAAEDAEDAPAPADAPAPMSARSGALEGEGCEAPLTSLPPLRRPCDRSRRGDTWSRPIVERRDDGSRALAMIQRERELHPVCDRTGARVETCLSCGGRGCTEELREALARAQAGAR